MSSKTASHSSRVIQEQIILARESNLIGASQPRMDSTIKVDGRTVYVRDMRLPRMLYGKVKRSPYAHARIIRIDVEKVKHIPVVKAVITGRDFAAPTSEDTPPLAFDEVLYASQGVCARAPATPHTKLDERTMVQFAMPANHNAEAIPHNAPCCRPVQFASVRSRHARSVRILTSVETVFHVAVQILTCHGDE